MKYIYIYISRNKKQTKEINIDRKKERKEVIRINSYGNTRKARVERNMEWKAVAQVFSTDDTHKKWQLNYMRFSVQLFWCRSI